ncbi:MAG TPA: L-lactate dehydrogenase [Propionibacteriaceae bacterium]|nr:L-lactate dehydrogenase [Micropruina sp.]HBX82779.1 L-lactate dehydrogenase [Propionibacteriaceae bacterium]HBY23104.1 L-lactate dehydrogenase [Propionibacteriaceae bacterium]
MKYAGNKVVLIGTGAVGVAYAYALVNQGICEELVLIDINEKKARADVRDLNHCEAWAPSAVTVTFGDYSDCSTAAMVVICAGIAQKPGQSRLDLIQTNMGIFKDIVGKVMNSGFDGIFLVATNPVDILTYATWRYSGLPAAQVMGSGTTLDTARFRFNLAQYFGVATTNVHANIIGEHGDSELPVWSGAVVAGRSMHRLLEVNPEIKVALDEIFIQTRDEAYGIIEAKGSTSYGIGMALARITRAVLRNQKITLPISALLQGQYGHRGLYIGVPASVGRQGVGDIIELDLETEEQEMFDQSVATLKEAQAPFWPDIAPA